MFPLLRIAILFLAGCYGQGPAYYSYEGQQILQQRAADRQCQEFADHASSDAVLHWAKTACRSMRGGGMVMTPMYPAFRGTQGTAIGQDPFGPMGYRGPTWEQFNKLYSQPPSR